MFRVKENICENLFFLKLHAILEAKEKPERHSLSNKSRNLLNAKSGELVHNHT